MIVSITGSRTITDYKLVVQAVKESGFKITKIISGGAAGVDTLAEIYAKNNNIPFEEYKADWKTFGKRAGPIRNKEMADQIDAAIIIWNGVSKGTLNYLELVKNKPHYLKKAANKHYSNNVS